MCRKIRCDGESCKVLGFWVYLNKASIDGRDRRIRRSSSRMPIGTNSPLPIASVRTQKPAGCMDIAGPVRWVCGRFHVRRAPASICMHDAAVVVGRSIGASFGKLRA